MRSYCPCSGHEDSRAVRSVLRSGNRKEGRDREGNDVCAGQQQMVWEEAEWFFQGRVQGHMPELQVGAPVCFPWKGRGDAGWTPLPHKKGENVSKLPAR